MRENTKPILWIAVIAFILTIFAVWGLDVQTGQQSTQSTLVGRVDGVPITRSQYQLQYQQFAQQYRASSNNQPLTYAQEEFLQNQVWDNLVYSILTDQEIERLGISVTDDEIVAYLRTSPPQEIRQFFLDEAGNFDMGAYQAALNNPEIDWTQLEQLARERIPRIKLNEYLTAQVHVSEEEIRMAYEQNNIEVTLQYVAFETSLEEMADYEPDEAAMRAHYDAHPDEFEQPEKARIDVIRIPMEPSELDRAATRETAAELLDDIRSGKVEFGKSAKDLSEAPTSFVEGNTGFLTRGHRDDAFFDALDAVTDGEIADIVDTAEGVYLVKLIEKRENEAGTMEYNAQEILVTHILSRQTTDEVLALGSSIEQKALEVDFAAVAEEFEVDVISPEPFFESSPIGEIGFVPSLTRFAFTNEAGSVSPVLRDEDFLFVARVVERIPAGIMPFEGAEALLRARVTSEHRRSIAEQKATGFSVKSRMTSFEDALETYGVVASSPEPFTAAQGFDDFPPYNAACDAALLIAPDQVSPAVAVGERYVVFKLITRGEIDRDDYKAQVPGLRDQLRGQKAQSYVGNWYESLKDKSEIEDLRTQSS
jgi:parvulin-like peptidyl-prolyl isomerase